MISGYHQEIKKKATERNYEIILMGDLNINYDKYRIVESV